MCRTFTKMVLQVQIVRVSLNILFRFYLFLLLYMFLNLRHCFQILGEIYPLINTFCCFSNNLVFISYFYLFHLSTSGRSFFTFWYLFFRSIRLFAQFSSVYHAYVSSIFLSKLYGIGRGYFCTFFDLWSALLLTSAITIMVQR